VGDLRPPHFFASHMMQAVPALGWLADRTLPPFAAMLGAWIAAAAWAGLAWWLFREALAGGRFSAERERLWPRHRPKPRARRLRALRGIRLDRCAVAPPGHQAVLDAGGLVQVAGQQVAAGYQRQQQPQCDEGAGARRGWVVGRHGRPPGPRWRAC